MINNILKQILLFTKLPATKQVVFLLLGMTCFFGTIAYYSWRSSEKEKSQEVLEKTIKLDTCESINNRYLKEITYWKDSLYSEKVKNLNEELKHVRDLSKNVKIIEKDIIKTNTNIKNTQYKIIKSLKHEK